MDYLVDDRNPEVCRSFEMDCGTCVERSAGTVASICRGMTEAALQNTFIQLYASPGCAPMAGAFESAYLAGNDIPF